MYVQPLEPAYPNAPMMTYSGVMVPKSLPKEAPLFVAVDEVEQLMGPERHMKGLAK
jgi:hypothetical protein